MPTPATDGLVIVDKPAGLTSHDVVARLRRLAHTRKVGHAGTLDPMATGVLVLGVGKATRLLHHLVLADKAYTATIRLGQATVTDDAEGEVVSQRLGRRGHRGRRPGGDDAVHRRHRAGAERGVGDQGRRASAPTSGCARASRSTLAGPSGHGGAVRRCSAVRRDGDLLDVDVDVECSSGTYVRALARDLGAALGVGGHLTALRRTRVGPFDLDQARTLDELAALDDPVTLPLAAAVRAAMPVRTVDDDEARALSYGKPLAASGIDGVHGALTADGTAVALLRDEGAEARPVLVFAAAG